MAESNEHHVKYHQYFTYNYIVQTASQSVTYNYRYNGVITVLDERFVIYDEYVDTQIWTTGSACRGK